MVHWYSALKHVYIVHLYVSEYVPYVNESTLCVKVSWLHVRRIALEITLHC